MPKINWTNLIVWGGLFVVAVAVWALAGVGFSCLAGWLA